MHICSKDVCTRIFVLEKREKLIKHSTVDTWLNEIEYDYSLEYYKALNQQDSMYVLA